MTTPGRSLNVRLSVRTETESIDPVYLTVQRSWAHVRYQRFRIRPIGPQEREKLDRESKDANWRAQARGKPEIPERAHLVAVDSDGSATGFVLSVVKVLREANRQILYLKEVTEVQS